jgi:hypothetical protein
MPITAMAEQCNAAADRFRPVTFGMAFTPTT